MNGEGSKFVVNTDHVFKFSSNAHDANVSKWHAEWPNISKDNSLLMYQRGGHGSKRLPERNYRTIR